MKPTLKSIKLLERLGGLQFHENELLVPWRKHGRRYYAIAKGPYSYLCSTLEQADAVVKNLNEGKDVA